MLRRTTITFFIGTAEIIQGVVTAPEYLKGQKEYETRLIWRTIGPTDVYLTQMIAGGALELVARLDTIAKGWKVHGTDYSPLYNQVQ